MEHLYFIARLFDFSDLKVKIAAFWAGFLSAAFSFLTYFSNSVLGISLFLFCLLFVVMIIDFITGLAAAFRENQKFKSKRGLEWVFKFGFYLMTLSISLALRSEVLRYNLDWLLAPHLIWHYYILLHIFFWEVKSIDENFERLGYRFRILKLFTSLFLNIKSLIDKKFKNDSK